MAPDEGRAAILTSLHETTREMMSAESVDRVADILTEAAKRLLDVSFAVVYLHDATGPIPISDGNVPAALEGDCQRLVESLQESEDTEAQVRVSANDNDTTLHALHMGDHGTLVVASTQDQLSESDAELVRILATNGEVALDRAVQLRQLGDREADLVEERNRLAALFENIPSPTASFVIEDDEPVVESVNPAFEEVFGFSESELVGEHIDDYIVPSGRETEAEEYNDLLQQGKNVNVEVRRLTTEGPRDFLLDVVPFRLDALNVHGYAMYTDITERKRREQELERQNERLEQFASIVSHDIRNPLNVAQGYLDVARDDPQNEYFDRIDDALDRVDDIVDSVLTLAREGRTVTEPEPTNLAETAKTAWKNVATTDATLTVEPDADREILGDRKRLVTVFENLFRNSVEHAGETVTITVGCIDDDGFYVMDDGPGIPDDYRDQIFDSGFTTRENGTGFGLAIVSEIVDAHDWTIEISDNSDAGARFEITGVDWAEDIEDEDSS